MKQFGIVINEDFVGTKVPKSLSKMNNGKWGSVYTRNGKLWITFNYMNHRVREGSGLDDIKQNRNKLRLFLDKVYVGIQEGSFRFGEYFPNSNKREFFTILEGGTVMTDPSSIRFGEYWTHWMETMGKVLSAGQFSNYQKDGRNYILPYFKDLPFSEFKTVLMKKFLAHLQIAKSNRGTPLAAKTIKNIMIPLRTITYAAIEEYDFDIPDPFATVSMPKKQATKIYPLSYDEWNTLYPELNNWYKPYFEFAILTGLRPSEQTALKWTAIDEHFIHIELSRVRQGEKSTLKTDGSNRRIQIRQPIRDVLERQKAMTSRFESEYVFINKDGNPIVTGKLYVGWSRALKRAGIAHRRMYETRHTFATWALMSGEQPGWVARTLGHADLTMVYTVYARFIPNLLENDGGKFDSIPGKKKAFDEAVDQKSEDFGHNFKKS